MNDFLDNLTQMLAMLLIIGAPCLAAYGVYKLAQRLLRNRREVLPPPARDCQRYTVGTDFRPRRRKGERHGV